MRYLKLCLLANFLYASLTFADLPKEPKDFYPTGYVHGSIDELRAQDGHEYQFEYEVPNQNDSGRDSDPDSEPDTRAALKSDYVGLEQAQSGDETKDDHELGRIDTIGVILQVSQIDSYYDEIIAIADKRKVKLGDIYLLGVPDLERQLPKFIALKLRGAEVMIRDAPPRGFKISHTPAWIVSTAGGDVVLEAPPKFSSLIVGDRERATLEIPSFGLESDGPES